MATPTPGNWFMLPVPGGDVDTWGLHLNSNFTIIDAVLKGNDNYRFDASLSSLKIGGTAVLATASELNLLRGANITTADLVKLHAINATASEINKLAGMTTSRTELNRLTGLTASSARLNILDGAQLTTAELNILAGANVTTGELNQLVGLTNHVQAVWSAGAATAGGIITPLKLMNAVKSVTMGINQSWQSPARSPNTTYTNTGTSPIEVMIALGTNVSGDVLVTQDGALSVFYSNTDWDRVSITFTVPPGDQYRVNTGAGNITHWKELR